MALADVLWDNGSFDGRNGLASFYWGGGDWSVTVDDVILSSPVRVDTMTGQFALGAGKIVAADVSVWAMPERGGKPGPRLALRYYAPVSYERIGEIHGYPVYSVTAYDVNLELAPGDYYFGMQIEGGFAWLCTAGNGQLKGYGAGWYWGVPLDDWWPARRLLGYDSDFAFRIEGIAEPGTSLSLLLAAPLLVRYRSRRGGFRCAGHTLRLRAGWVAAKPTQQPEP